MSTGPRLIIDCPTIRPSCPLRQGAASQGQDGEEARSHEDPDSQDQFNAHDTTERPSSTQYQIRAAGREQEHDQSQLYHQGATVGRAEQFWSCDPGQAPLRIPSERAVYYEESLRRK